MRRLALALSLLGAAGCFLVLDPDGLELTDVDAGRADATSDASQPLDAGQPADASLDAGTDDAGQPEDAGADAGSEDAGQPEDAGVDAGTPEDAGVGDAGVSCPPNMLGFEGGSFALFASPSTAVEVGAFCLDKAEVMTTEYRAYLATEEGATRPAPGGACNFEREGEELLDREAHPVNCVTRDQAADYCGRQGKRLPSEAEWEWATRRGGGSRPYPWGTSDPMDAPFEGLCWSGLQVRQSTCRVLTQSLDYTGLGEIADLAGNVSEWTSSVEGASGVIRGGSWASRTSPEVSTSQREVKLLSWSSAMIGFRCAK